ncbi:BspA family leucine-rich repeat surface protein [Flavobacterium sp.]|uniref:BspA family leucine-rich repeat surface protein n=1 Tax=Flavobacterium sp. TaxID=239 RepID=UPI00262C5C94|nr:BspA family leucine-rich repeat surface protein [Flavobacterium sp.]
MKKLIFALVLIGNAVLAQNPFIATYQTFEFDYKLTLKFKVFNKKDESVDFTVKWETLGWPNKKGKTKCPKDIDFVFIKIFPIANYPQDELMKRFQEVNNRIKVKIWLELDNDQYAELESGPIIIENWGDVRFKRLKIGNADLEVTATDTPKFTANANLDHAFDGSVSMVGNASFNNWDVSNVTSMNSMFELCAAFNQPLDKWNTSNVKYMNKMFKDATSFKQDISKWNMENVVSKEDIFVGVNKPKSKRIQIDKKDNPMSQKSYDFCYQWMKNDIEKVGWYRNDVQKYLQENKPKGWVQDKIKEIKQTIYLIADDLESRGCKNNLEDKGEKLKEYLNSKREDVFKYLSDKYYDENISKFDAELDGFKEDIDNYFAAYRITSPDEAPSPVTEVSTDTTAKTPEKKRVTYVWISITKMSYPTEMYNIDYAEVNAPEGTPMSVVSDAVKKPKIRIGFTNVEGGVYTCENKGCSSIINDFAKKYRVSAVNCGYYKVQ